MTQEPIGPGRRPPPRAGHRWLGRVGVVLLLAGALVAGYVGWQLLGTTWVAEQRHAAIRADLRAGWDRGQESVHVDTGTTGAVVRIPAFGDDYAVPVLEGTSEEVLASGFGHFAGTAGPGERGNYALAAHRITHGQPLRDLPELEAGDVVLVDTARTTYTYELLAAGDALTVPFTAGWVLAAHPANPDPDGLQPPRRAKRLLTLTTCSELFHTDGRLVAFAELVAAAPRRGNAEE